MPSRLIGRWVGVGALLLLASLTWVQPAYERLDGATAVRYRWWVTALADGTRPQPWLALFRDATGAPVDPGRVTHQYAMPPSLGEGKRVPPPVLEAKRVPLPEGTEVVVEGRERLGPGVELQRGAYPTGPEVPPDPWGQPWYLVIEYFELRGGHYRLEHDFVVRSGGPNGRLDFGGDDVVVGSLHPSGFQLRKGVRRPLDVPFDTEPLWAVLAVALGSLWLSASGFAAPRTARLTSELGASACAAAFPGVVAFLFAFEGRLERMVPVADETLAVSPRLAVALSVVLLLWAAIFVWRLRRPPTRAEG